MKTIQNVSAYLFIVCVVVLTVISVMGIWQFFEKDVIWKSFQTIGILGAVAVVVLVAGRFIDAKDTPGVTNAPVISAETGGEVNAFTTIRHLTLAVLIVAVVLLALVGIMAIWEMLSSDMTEKSLSSIALIAFSAFIIVYTCLEREGHKLIKQNQNVSGWVIVVVVLMAWWFVTSLF